MKAILHLLRYLMTWHIALLCFAFAGMLGLVLTVFFGVLIDREIAFGLAIYAFVPLLALPALFAWRPFRLLLASRRLALVPGFRLRLGLALLLLTTLFALFLPLASALLWPGMVPPRVAPALFLAMGLFTLLMQWVITSRYIVMWFSLGPPLLLYVAIRGWPLFEYLFAQPSFQVLAGSAALCGWVLALRIICRRNNFSKPMATPMNVRDYNWDGRRDWLVVVTGNYRGAVRTAAGTLLFGYPDGLAGRIAYFGNLLVLSPLAGMFVLYLLSPVLPDQEWGQMESLPRLFTMLSLFSAFTAAFANGELAARCRLLWMRRGGDRNTQWRWLERRLGADFILFTLFMLFITGVLMFLLDGTTFDPATYILLTLGSNLFGSYFSLVGRLNRWSLLVQLLIIAAGAAGIGISRDFGLLPLPLLLALLLALALLCRQWSQRLFTQVDWYLLRPACQSFKGKLV